VGQIADKLLHLEQCIEDIRSAVNSKEPDFELISPTMQLSRWANVIRGLALITGAKTIVVTVQSTTGIIKGEALTELIRAQIPESWLIPWDISQATGRTTGGEGVRYLSSGNIRQRVSSVVPPYKHIKGIGTSRQAGIETSIVGNVTTSTVRGAVTGCLGRRDSQALAILE
jgi:hypothetical protein